jgi:hypothetical protein
MPEQDNDRLEQFFRKAASKPDVTFNEDDWKKLEARLDAEGAGLAGTKKTGNKIATAVVVGTLLFFSGAFWVNSRYDIIPLTQTDKSAEQSDKKITETLAGLPDTQAIGPAEIEIAETNKETAKDQREIPIEPENPNDAEQKKIPAVQEPGQILKPGDGEQTSSKRDESIVGNNLPELMANEQPAESTGVILIKRDENLIRTPENVSALENEKIFRELIQGSPVNTSKIKQKAVDELPGAEEENRREARSIVREEQASDHKKHVAAPRLSLLLSFAPDFSGTSMNEYSAPGKAFGAMIHYHVKNRWSVSAGVIKNNKRYTSPGEDYHPPKNYWKYYTNGIVPSSIDGSCNVLEFPVMIQYTIASNGKNRWLVGGGASSYVMLTESYRYNFQQPNPGAKEGWDSKRRSHCLFNMANFTVGYEHQVLPGLMIGIEPYVKIPLEQIGWSNIRLFSSGANITLRYRILGKDNVSTPTRSRGPD